MQKTRQISEIFAGKPTLEGAGVHLKRAFGYYQTPLFDPFLMLDDFHSSDPQDYMAGFPWHPHRGIETVTYVLHGEVDHGDSMGNRGAIGSGDVQWMTAGSGIIHQEMPRETPEKLMWGFQLWVNLPAKHKMMEPRYRDVPQNSIPEILLENGIKIKVIAGNFEGMIGPVQDLIVACEYLDVLIPAGVTFEREFDLGDKVFAYIVDGSGFFEPDSDAVGAEHIVLYGAGSGIKVTAGNEYLRILLISGTPINESIAWGGPIVMNTEEELQLAFKEYQEGTFVKHR